MRVRARVHTHACVREEESAHVFNVFICLYMCLCVYSLYKLFVAYEKLLFLSQESRIVFPSQYGKPSGSKGAVWPKRYKQ